jgi:site-specific DNA recombinase
MRYVIFSRVSTSMQTTENQIWECRNYVNSVKKHHDEVIEFDEPETSTRLKPDKRPVLKAMREFVKRGDTLVVYKMNRLARDSEEMIVIYNDLLRKDVNVYSINEPKLDKSIICVFAMVAEMERESIRKTTITGLKRKQAMMEKVGTTWYGYKEDETRLQPREKVRSTGKPYLLIPDDNEAAQVELMYELYKQGYTYGQIVTELETRGFRNRKGNPVHKSTVYRVLQRVKMRNQVPMAVACC